MLTTLRNKTAGIIMKVILGLIVVSFAVWGVADVFRMGVPPRRSRKSAIPISRSRLSATDSPAKCSAPATSSAAH